MRPWSSPWIGSRLCTGCFMSQGGLGLALESSWKMRPFLQKELADTLPLADPAHLGPCWCCGPPGIPLSQLQYNPPPQSASRANSPARLSGYPCASGSVPCPPGADRCSVPVPCIPIRDLTKPPSHAHPLPCAHPSHSSQREKGAKAPPVWAFQPTHLRHLPALPLPPASVPIPFRTGEVREQHRKLWRMDTAQGQAEAAGPKVKAGNQRPAGERTQEPGVEPSQGRSEDRPAGRGGPETLVFAGLGSQGRGWDLGGGV